MHTHPTITNYSVLEDGELVSLLNTGNREAFDELYRRYWLLLYDAAYKRLEDKQQAEDIVQEVFIRLWMRRNEVAIGAVAAYLHTAVRYSVLSYITRHKVSLSFYNSFEALLLLEKDTPEDQLLTKELLVSVYAYAETLSERKKQIFLLHVHHKLTTREIADALEISQKAVQNQLGPTLDGLRSHLAPVVLAIIASRF